MASRGPSPVKHHPGSTLQNSPAPVYCTFDSISSQQHEKKGLSLTHVLFGALLICQILVLAICSAALHRVHSVTSYTQQQGVSWSAAALPFPFPTNATWEYILSDITLAHYSDNESLQKEDSIKLYGNGTFTRDIYIRALTDKEQAAVGGNSSGNWSIQENNLLVLAVQRCSGINVVCGPGYAATFIEYFLRIDTRRTSKLQSWLTLTDSTTNLTTLYQYSPL